MRANDLDNRELLELVPEEGIIRFAGQRAILLDAVAMGLLRKYLVENFGLHATRTILTQFGFAHGWQMAQALEEDFTWDNAGEWRNAGTRLSALGGLFRLDPASQDPLAKAGMHLAASYEAEQHLLHFGPADLPMCWTICGLVSGFLSKSSGREIFVLEDRCLARGDAMCRLFARTRAEWSLDRPEELHFFEKNGLKDCLEISLERVTETMKVVKRKVRKHRQAIAHLVPEDEGDFLGIVAKSPVMHNLLTLAKRVAKVDSTVLILGESGSGKERIARLVHEVSPRSAGPFIAINCGAITETLLESELFGHARGAFTGATQDRPGVFEAANKGTLLLDEVGDISPGMQIKLLRALQEREIRRVGETKVRRIDVRILAATHRDLALEVKRGTFRKDLYYRLKVVELQVPPLRVRREDILALAQMLLAHAAVRMNRKLSGFSPAAANHLLGYAWPGNVRELENAMERAVALAQGNVVELEDLPEEVRQANPLLLPTRDFVLPLEAVEKDYILAALGMNGGNQARTASQLGIGAATLYRKLKAYKETD